MEDNRKSMKDLFIGSTSQLAHFWPKENVEMMSSRNINIDYILSKSWNRIYIAYADGRTYLRDWKMFDEFYKTNLQDTLALVNEVKHVCNNVVYFSTTELWNRHHGPVNLGTPFNFDVDSPYINSKAIVTRKLLLNNGYGKVIVLFPFSFNCAFRNDQQYLFSKIFHSIINREKVKIGNTRFYRDLLHPSFVAFRAARATCHEIIGSGRMIFVDDFINDLYSTFLLRRADYVEQDDDSFEKRGEFYLQSKECLYSYSQLLYNTCMDIVRIKVSKGDFDGIPAGML